MNRFGAYLKTAIVQGFFVLLPLFVIGQLLVKAIHLAKANSVPIANLFPKAISENPRFPLILGCAIIAVLCFVTGVLTRSVLFRRFGTAFERMVLLPLPGYGALKALTRSLSDSSDEGAFKPGLFLSEDGYREFVYLIEDHGDGFATVMVPGSPSAVTGSVRIVRRNTVEILDASLPEVAAVLSQLGVGSRDLLVRSADRKGKRDSGRD